MSNLSFILLCLLWQFPLRASYISPIEPPSFKKSFDLSLQTEFFRSHSNYTNWGEYSNLPEDHSFQYILFKPEVSYSPFNGQAVRLSTFAETFYASSQTSRIEKQLPFKLSALGGSLDFYHKVQSLFIGLKFTGAYSFHSLLFNENTKTFTVSDIKAPPLPQEIIVGENAHYIEPSLHFIFKPNPYFYIYNRNAFRYRMNGLSSLAFSDLGVIAESENISGGFSLNTFFSLAFLDSFSNDPQKRHQALKTNNAGSYKFYSVNPSVISGTAWLSFKYSLFDTKFYLNIDTLGKNYGKGLSLGLITRLKFQKDEDSFLEKKREKNRYMDFDSKDLPVKSKVQQNSSYFDEEEDPYTQEEEEDPTTELRQELKLLSE